MEKNLKNETTMQLIKDEEHSTTGVHWLGLFGKARENNGEDLSIVVDEMNFQSLSDETGQIVIVFAVLGRQ